LQQAKLLIFIHLCFSRLNCKLLSLAGAAIGAQFQEGGGKVKSYLLEAQNLISPQLKYSLSSSFCNNYIKYYFLIIN
jgi:hypothetical protein